MKKIGNLCKLLLLVSMLVCLASCAGSEGAKSSEAPASDAQTEASKEEATESKEEVSEEVEVTEEANAEPKYLNMAVSFFYPSLDVHKDYYGWYTSIYGVSETLFKVGDDMSIKPLLAKG